MSSSREGAGRTVHKPVSDALARLRRGEMSIDGYLDSRAAKAIEHLKGTLSAEALELVRQTIRAALAEDPALSEQVRRLAGADTLLPGNRE